MKKLATFYIPFSQGMAPIVMVVPLPHTIHSLSKDKMQLKHQYPQTWERIRDKPTYWTLNNEQRNFVVSFRIRKCDPQLNLVNFL